MSILIFFVTLVLFVTWTIHATTTTVRVVVPAAAYGKDPWASTASLRQAFTAQTGITIEFVPLGAVSTTYVSSAIQTILTTHSSYVDVILMDVVWIGNYGEHLLPLGNDAGLAAALQPHNPQNIAAGVYHGNLVAIPQRADYGVLYSRMDLLNRFGFSNPPKTWDEMENMIATILPEIRKTKPAFLGISNHINPEEGFTCNILEWLGADNAGTLLEPDGTLSSFDQSSSVGRRVLQVAQRWHRWNQNGWLQVGMSQAVTANQWVKGNTIFLRHWPYISSTTRDSNVTWPWTMSMLPGNAATLGGWLWGVSKYTKQPEAAKRVLELFASVAWQKVRAVAEGNSPTITALYNDSDVCAVLPICDLASQFKVVRRPSSAAGMQYTQVSATIYNRWFDVVRGYGGSISSVLDLMNRDLAKLLNIDVLGTPTNVAIHEISVAIFGTVAVCMAAVLIAILVLFAVARTTSVVSHLGLTSFLAPTLLGLVLQLSLISTTAGVPTSATCYARYWIHGIGYTLAVMSITMHNHYIWSTSLNPFLTKRAPSVRVALATVVAPLVATVAILIGFTASGAINANDIKLSKSRYFECKSTDPNVDSAVRIVWYAWLGAQMLVALWTAFKASKLATAPQEPRAMLVCLANASMLAIVILPFTDLGLVDQSTGYILRSVLIEVPIVTFLFVFLAPRLWIAWQTWKNPEMEKVFSQSSASILKSSTAGHKTSAPGDTSTHAVVTAPKVHIGTASPTAVTDGAARPALNVNELAQVGSFKERHAIGCEGVVSVRQVNKTKSLFASAFAFMRPWTFKRLFVLRQAGLLALHDLSSQAASVRATCIPTHDITSVKLADVDNVFMLTRADGTISELMVSSGDEAKKWVAAIQGVLVSTRH